MKTIEITIDASNMNAEELKKAIKTAIFGNDNTNTKKIDKKDMFLARKLAIISEENYNLVKKIVNGKETVQELNEILSCYKSENNCFKRILKERKNK